MLAPVDYAALPGWPEGRQAAALTAFHRSCARITALADETRLGPGGLAGRAADWRPACAAAGGVAAADDAAARRFFERWFRPFRAAGAHAADGLFTGYYEPELRGARHRGGRYTVPLYGRPADLVTARLGAFDPELDGRRLVGRVEAGAFVPYPDRAAIEAGALDGVAPVLLWVDDPADAFFLQVQGSGRVVLADGTVVRVGFAGHNGRAYTAIGRELVRRGALARDAVTLPAIRAWLAAHPAEGPVLLASNPRYVFFRQVDGEGPIGAEGVVLSPGRSLAVDRRRVALGLPIWLDTLWPGEPGRPLRRLVVAQDTGGAIRGPVRGDLFWGYGAEAEARAGAMRSPGRYYLLLPRSVAARRLAGS